MAGKVRIMVQKFIAVENEVPKYYLECAVDGDATPPTGNWITGSLALLADDKKIQVYSETSESWNDLVEF